VFGVERDVSAARLEHGQPRDDQLKRPPEQDADAHFRPDALPAQVVRQSVGPRVEFRVRQPPSRERHGERLGRPSHLRFD
jgi:hypothetical protein